MASEGHAPTVGLGNRIWLLSKRVCPDCRPDYGSVNATPDLEPAGDSTVECPRCDGRFHVGGGAR